MTLAWTAAVLLGRLGQIDYPHATGIPHLGAGAQPGLTGYERRLDRGGAATAPTRNPTVARTMSHVLGYRVPALLIAGMPVLLMAGITVLLALGRRPRRFAVAVSAFVVIAGAVLLVTLAPRGISPAAPRTCGASLTALGLRPWAEDQRLLKALMFVPLGVLSGLLLRGSRLPVAVALGLPFVIETVQAAVPLLGRSCDVSDVYDNTAGTFLGLLLAGVILIFHEPWRGNWRQARS